MRRSGNSNEEEGETAENVQEAWRSLEVEDYGPFFVQDYTQFFMKSQPLDYFEDLVTYLNTKQIAHRISDSKLKLKFNTQLARAAASEEQKGDDTREVAVGIEVLKVDDNKHCVKFSYKDPATRLNLSTSRDIIQHFMAIRDAQELGFFCDTTFDEELN